MSNDVLLQDVRFADLELEKGNKVMTFYLTCLQIDRTMMGTAAISGPVTLVEERRDNPVHGAIALVYATLR